MFFDISVENVSSTLAYAGGIVSDLMPYIVIFVGIAIAGVVIDMILTRRSKQ